MIHLKILCDPTMIPDTAVYLSKVAEKYGVSERKAHMACFVIETILELRMQEADQKEPVLLLDVKKEKNELLISITDKGLPYVLTDYQKMILKKGLVDRFYFEQLGTNGQRITVVFQMTREEIDSSVSAMMEKEEVWKDHDFKYRPTIDQDEDIVKAIRCIYTSYGFNYIHQELYNVDIFKDMLKSGRYISVLAENTAQQVAGHIAIEEHKWFPGIMEVCNLVVKPSVRGKNISNHLVESVINLGQERHLSGLYSMPAMFHPISQKLSTENGFYPCGMYFHLLGDNVAGEYKGRSSRLSAAFSVHVYDMTTAHVLYLPEECSEFVIDVFEKQKINHTSRTAVPELSGKTSLSYTLDTLSRRLEIKIDAAGADLEESLQNLLFREKSEMIEVVMVYLNMNDPGCPPCYTFLRNLGLIFTGCLPGSKSNDYLLLQHLKGRPIAKEKIVAEPDYQRMLDSLYRINGIE